MDIYSDEKLDQVHSMHYLHIKAANRIGILNRISSLMRRKRYNMEEVSVSFDSDNQAHIIIAIDSRKTDTNHVQKQLSKLHDVVQVNDVTDQYERIYNSISVKVKDESEFDTFPIKPHRIIKRNEKIKGVFILKLSETAEFMQIVLSGDYEYRRQIIGLI